MTAQELLQELHHTVKTMYRHQLDMERQCPVRSADRTRHQGAAGVLAELLDVLAVKAIDHRRTP